MPVAISRIILFFIITSCVLQGQPGAPIFKAEDVRPHGAATPYPLVPGSLVWIFGKNLGNGCSAENVMDRATYRTNLCGTRVLVGGSEARLIYASENQINLRLPDGPWENQMIGVQVIRDGIGSSVVPVRFGSRRP